MKPFSIPPIYEGLAIIMRYFPDNFSQQAVAEIETLQEYCMEKITDDSERFLTLLFLKALKQHIGTNTIDEHIYLKKFEIPQIKLFDILIKEFPFVKYSHIISNQLLANEIRKHKKVALIDIGIGRGLQMAGVVELLKLNPGNVSDLQIIGIEPFEDALQVAESILQNSLETLPVQKKSFTAIHCLVENMKLADFEKHIQINDTAIIINESLALHHLNTQDDRVNALRTLKALHPKAFVLTEPNVDHFEPDFYTRFKNSFQHFYHVFQVIDQLDISKEEKSGLKLFFGREIEDIIGKQKEERFEKHEPALHWLDKLKKTGFNIRTGFYDGENVINCGIVLENRPEGFLGFRYEDETVLSIIIAEATDYKLIQPIDTNKERINIWFPESVSGMTERLIFTHNPIDIVNLDKNEMPFDITQSLKHEVFKELDNTFWNRYPTPYYPELEKLIASYCQIQPSCVLIAAGAAQLISTCIHVFGKLKGDKVVASPSFSLFEYQLKVNDTSYKTWEINKKLEYESSLFPSIKEPAMVMLASPNNPTGNSIDPILLESLLTKYPDSIFIIDEVYHEFSDHSCLPLLKRYSNLIVIRSLSKAFSAAGVRIGYAMSSPQIIQHLRKYILPFSLNHLSVAFTRTLFSKPEFLNYAGHNVLSIIRERDKVYHHILNHKPEKGFEIFNSKANFLFIRFDNLQTFRHYLDLLSKHKIKVLNLGSHPLLENSIRISIGNSNQNQLLMQIFSKT